MDTHFLQLRGHGCNGIWNIFQRARTLLDTPTSTPALATRQLALLLADADSWQAPFWEKAAALAGFTVSTVVNSAELHALQPAIGVVSGFDDNAMAALVANAGTSIILNAGNDSARPCQVMADMLATVQRLGPDADHITKVRICWIGGADGPNAGFVNSWLDMALCFQHELFLSFPQGREPNPDPLDFAMNAGAKIFLTYDPSMVLDGAHALIAAPWLAPSDAIVPRHPLLADTALASAAKELFILPVPSIALPISTETQQQRTACLVACQTALLEHLVEVKA